MTDAAAIALGFQPADDSRAPFEDVIGPIYQRRESAGDFTYAFRVRKIHTGPTGTAHGGSLMSFASTALSHAGFNARGNSLACLSVNASFLAPAQLGDLVICRPRLSHQTREILFLSGDCLVGESIVLSVKSLWQPGEANRKVK